MATVFFRLLAHDDKPAALAQAVDRLRVGEASPDVHVVDPESFRQVPGSPFAYWVSEKVRRLFKIFPKFESDERKVRLGDHPSDDFRYLRLAWEIASDASRRDWRPYIKGGAFSPYYYGVHLFVDWDENRQTYRDFYGRPGRANARPSNYKYFFMPCVTWPRRTSSKLSARVVPEGCVFADKGPVVISDKTNLLFLLSLMNSQVFECITSLQLGAADVAARSYEVGLIQNVPFPILKDAKIQHMSILGELSVDSLRSLDRSTETSHVFHLPALLQVSGETLSARISSWQNHVADTNRQLAEHQREIDDIAFRLYGIDGEDRRMMETGVSVVDSAGPDEDEEAEEEDES